jgi:hypothetical protein
MPSCRNSILFNWLRKVSYLIFTGRSRWCAEDKLEPNLYNVGFEVGSLSYDDSMIFQRMYERYGADSRW